MGIQREQIWHGNVHKYAWISPDGKTLKQIFHILIDRRRHSSILDVRSITVTDCGTDHYLVVAKVRERLALSKQVAQKFDVERFYLRKPRSRRLGNSIRLRSQTGLQLWRI
jgi:hypothetical protein